MAAEAHRSMLSGMFSFMKKTSRVRHNPESEGIYLSDLNADELDPEVAALYFPTSHRGPIAKGKNLLPPVPPPLSIAETESLGMLHAHTLLTLFMFFSLE